MKYITTHLSCLGFILVLLVTQTRCQSFKPSSKSENLKDSYIVVDFCKINPSTENKLIETTAYYSGIEEYWSLSSNQNCKYDKQIYLDINNIKRRSIRRRFLELHENYWKYSLKIKIKGELQYTDEEIGFGHLGLLRFQIVPVEVQILEKKPIF